MDKRVRDLTGEKFGLLVVLRWSCTKRGSSRGKGLIKRTPFWIVRCVCGAELEVCGKKLKNGTRTSCGNRKVHPEFRRTLVTKEQAGHRVFVSYKKSARKRGIEWGLSEGDFYQMITSPCHYSGSLPKKPIVTDSGIFLWNGVDRVDSSKGYFPDNCVPCSAFANTAKLDRPYSEFIEWLDQVAEFRRT
jgi:hypothetical protein